MNIDEFATARLDEDETTALATTPAPGPGRWRTSRDKHAESDAPLHLVQGEELRDFALDDGEYASTPIIAYSAEWQSEAEANLRHIARHDPARVLRDVAAMRAILELHKQVSADEPIGDCTTGCQTCHYDRGDCVVIALGLCGTVRHLASPYAEHPDYKEGWKP